jgi:hypothetical protein
MVAAAMSPVAFAASGPAQLHVRVLDDRHGPLAAATVTIYTLDGKPGVTVTADDNGVATFESVATGMTQIVARSAHFVPSIGKMTLQAGDNTQVVRLHLDSDESE